MQGRNLSTLHLSFFESRLFSLPNHIPLHQGVSYFCRTASSNVSGLKTKTLEALQLQGFVLVDDTGLEPVTSRTSSGCSTSCANHPNSMDYYTRSYLFCQHFFRISPEKKIFSRCTPFSFIFSMKPLANYDIMNTVNPIL